MRRPLRLICLIVNRSHDQGDEVRGDGDGCEVSILFHLYISVYLSIYFFIYVCFRV